MDYYKLYIRYLSYKPTYCPEYSDYTSVRFYGTTRESVIKQAANYASIVHIEDIDCTKTSEAVEINNKIYIPAEYDDNYSEYWETCVDVNLADIYNHPDYLTTHAERISAEIEKNRRDKEYEMKQKIAQFEKLKAELGKT